MPDASTQTDNLVMNDILDALRDIREDTHRNSLVAEKYGKKGDVIFDLVEKMGNIIKSPFRLLWYDTRPSPLLKDQI